MTIIIAVVFIVCQRKRIMKLKYKMLILIGVVILSAVLSFAIMQKEKPDISGVWVNEDEIAIEFFTRGVWLSEEGFEGLGGEKATDSGNSDVLKTDGRTKGIKAVGEYFRNLFRHWLYLLNII